MLETDMIKFKKASWDFVRLGTWSHFLMNTLEPDQSLEKFTDDEIITSVIKSKFHYWRGEEEPEGLKIDVSDLVNGKRENYGLNGVKLYGYFDNSKIKSSDYKQVAFVEFKEKLFAVIDDWNDSDKPFREKAEQLIIEKLNPEASFYHLIPNRVKSLPRQTYVYS